LRTIVAAVLLFAQAAMAEPQRVLNDAPDPSTMVRAVDATPDTDPGKPRLVHLLADALADRARGYGAHAAAEREPRKTEYTRKQAQLEAAALERYRWILEPPEKFRNYARGDEVLFAAAQLLARMHRDEESRRYYMRLVKDWPQSRFVPAAYVVFGDYYYDRKQLDVAVEFYERAARSPDSPVFAHARDRAAEIRRTIGTVPEPLH
jgi:tetratricopeptide (TPR) repeat protein